MQKSKGGEWGVGGARCGLAFDQVQWCGGTGAGKMVGCAGCRACGRAAQRERNPQATQVSSPAPSFPESPEPPSSISNLRAPLANQRNLSTRARLQLPWFSVAERLERDKQAMVEERDAVKGQMEAQVRGFFLGQGCVVGAMSLS